MAYGVMGYTVAGSLIIGRSPGHSLRQVRLMAADLCFELCTMHVNLKALNSF
jgi:hypothetical protein